MLLWLVQMPSLQDQLAIRLHMGEGDWFKAHWIQVRTNLPRMQGWRWTQNICSSSWSGKSFLNTVYGVPKFVLSVILSYSIPRVMPIKSERKINAIQKKSTINPIVKCASCLEVVEIASRPLVVHDSKQQTKRLKPSRSRMQHSILRIFQATKNY